MTTLKKILGAATVGVGVDEKESEKWRYHFCGVCNSYVWILFHQISDQSGRKSKEESWGEEI